MSECWYQAQLPRLVGAVGLLVALAASAPADAGEESDDAYLQLLAASCRACHGGGVAHADMPPLADLSSADIQRLLTDFRSGKQAATVMNFIASALSDEEIEQLGEMIGR